MRVYDAMRYSGLPADLGQRVRMVYANEILLAGSDPKAWKLDIDRVKLASAAQEAARAGMPLIIDVECPLLRKGVASSPTILDAVYMAMYRLMLGYVRAVEPALPTSFYDFPVAMGKQVHGGGSMEWIGAQFAQHVLFTRGLQKPAEQPSWACPSLYEPAQWFPAARMTVQTIRQLMPGVPVAPFIRVDDDAKICLPADTVRQRLECLRDIGCDGAIIWSLGNMPYESMPWVSVVRRFAKGD